ncbi:acetyltransferase [Hoeflea sp. AS60]|uniref:N-acyl amino acid synthase FeeM domain-containing protein n=1 Tax=Hoeflea sp. AS60 TaxID=3135780 RepID=UPI0031755B31
MTNADQGEIKGFSAGVMRFLESIEYRRIDNADDLEDVARIRYNAFTMVGLAPQNGSLLIDELDFKPNAHVMGVFFDEQLVSTIRVHHVTAAQRDSVAVAHFADVMNPLLDAGKTFIDPVRFAADPKIMREYPALPYLTLRVATMATVYFDVDYCLSVIKPNHRAFYKRVFNSIELTEPRYFERYDSNIELHGADAHELKRTLFERYPFFRSQPHERRMMFAPREVLGLTPLTILPTARYAVERAR